MKKKSACVVTKYSVRTTTPGIKCSKNAAELKLCIVALVLLNLFNKSSQNKSIISVSNKQACLISISPSHFQIAFQVLARNFSRIRILPLSQQLLSTLLGTCILPSLIDIFLKLQLGVRIRIADVQ